MDDFYSQESIRRVSGDPDLDRQMNAELRAEQMQYYRNANSQPFLGFGGMQGVKEVGTVVLIVLVLGLFFKYIVGVG
jgi:hypothetical protein